MESFLLNILGSIAEFEREPIKSRTSEVSHSRSADCKLCSFSASPRFFCRQIPLNGRHLPTSIRGERVSWSAWALVWPSCTRALSATDTLPQHLTPPLGLPFFRTF